MKIWILYFLQIKALEPKKLEYLRFSCLLFTYPGVREVLSNLSDRLGCHLFSYSSRLPVILSQVLGVLQHEPYPRWHLS